MNDNEKIVYCSRCGAEMKENARYCMKCGNLNYNHPDNKNMANFASKDDNTYRIGSGKHLSNKNLSSFNREATNTGNKNVFFIFNIVIIIIIAIIGVYLFTVNEIGSSIFLIVCSLFLLYFIPLEIIFMKANKPWWAALVPVYSNYVMGEVTLENGLLGLLVLIPVVNFFVMCIMFYNLGVKFKKNPILTLLFSLIMMPVIAFGTSIYKDTNYVNSNIVNDLEKDYHRRKLLGSVTVLFLIAGIGILVFLNLDNIQNSFKTNSQEDFIESAEKVIPKTKKIIEDKKFNCEDNTFNFEVGSTHYMLYYDVVGDLKINGFKNEQVQAEVAIYNNNGEYEYTLTLIDGDIGLQNVKPEDINMDNIKEDIKIINDNNRIYCYVE